MRLASLIPLFLCSALLLAAPRAGAQLTIVSEKVALTGEADPYGGLLPSDLKVFRLGDDGALLFHQDGVSSSRLYSGTYAGVSRRLADGARATANRPVTDFLFADENDAGQIAVMAYDGGQRNIYLLTGTTLKTVAVEGAAAASDGQSTFFYEPALDSAGRLAFKAETTESGMGIFFVDSTALSPVLEKIALVDSAPPQGGTFTFFDSRVSIASRPDGRDVIYFNAATTDGAGTDAAGFYVALIGSGAPPALMRIADGLHPEFAANRAGQAVYRDDTAIYRADVAGSTMLAQVGDAAPGGGTFSTLGDAAINDAGTVVFQAATASAPGLYVTTASGVRQLAVQGDIVGTEVLQSFGTPQINQNGLIAFSAEVSRGDNRATCLYLSDGTTLIRVIGNDDTLDGSAVQPWALEQSLVLDPGSLNLHGQLAFSAKLANGKAGLFLATPASHLRAGGPGLWDDPLTWDFSIVPGPDTPVLADSAADAVLQGPAASVARKVRSVKVGGGAGMTALHLQTGSTLTAVKGVSLADHGALSGSATIAGNLTMLSGSRLSLELSGPTRAGYDFLHVTGTATLGGTLDVTKSGFEPTRGQAFDLLDLARRVGTFEATLLPALNPDGQTWDVTKLYTTGAISVSGATLFAPTAGVFTGIFEGNPTAAATSGSLLLTLAPNGRLTGSIVYAGRRYLVSTTLNVDGSATVSFGLPKKTLQLQVATVNQAPQLTATVSSGGASESQVTADRTNPSFSASSPYVGHYTVALPPDPMHPEAAYPQGTGYAKVTVTTRGLATLVGVLGDGTAFSTGGPITAAGEFPFYVAAYALKGVVGGKLVLHGATPADPVEGSFRWLKPATTGKFTTAIDVTVTVIGSGYQNPVAPAKILTFANDQATFHPVGGDVGALPDKAVVLGTPYAFKSATAEPFAFTFSAATFGLGSGSFRDSANKVRTMKGVALQKQNEVVGLLIGTDQTGTFDIE